jgi:hypothetical protein
MITSGSEPPPAVAQAGFTWWSSGAFFECGDHCRWAHPQHPGGIADPAASESHVDHLAADVGGAAAILVLQEKDPPRALRVLTPLALGPVSLFPRLEHLCALTVTTLNRDVDHPLPPRHVRRRDEHTAKLLICNVTGWRYGCRSEGNRRCRLTGTASQKRLDTVGELLLVGKDKREQPKNQESVRPFVTSLNTLMREVGTQLSKLGLTTSFPQATP